MGPPGHPGLDGAQVVTATKVVLRQAHAETFGSHEPAFRRPSDGLQTVGQLGARKALEHTGAPRTEVPKCVVPAHW